MTTAEYLAIALVFVAISDFLLCYAWLLPKMRKGDAPEIMALLSPEEKERAKQKHKSIKKLKALMDCWVVVALAIAYFLWQNPEIF